MIRLEEIAEGMSVEGLEPERVVTVSARVPIGEDSCQVFYKLPDGTLRERLLSRGNEAEMSVATTARPWAFDGDGNAFRLAVEATRIDLAHLFDPMMAVHTSNLEPLPHQITAVYESMLPRQPLRYLLADDPGAGKTIMAGLYIRELLMRADANRVLVVAPGSLVEQWRDELAEKFGLEFRVFSRDLESSASTGNPFDDFDHIIVRLDQLSRNEELQEMACAIPWDLVIFDEAHKLSAHFNGSKVSKTKRYVLAERLGKKTRNLLLMTATPHNGKEEDFQLFLSLLDIDRFYGKFRDADHTTDASDLMRRMVKEELLRFDGRPLFPERRAYTVNYKLSDPESDLYEQVTDYVRNELQRAERLDGKRRGSVGFALTTLQRRLASSPEAIFQSLRRRRERLEQRLNNDARAPSDFQSPAEALWNEIPEDEDDLDAHEQEDLEASVVDEASASENRDELKREIQVLQELQQQAFDVVNSGQDRKWEELSRILQDDPNMRGPDGRMRKLIIFSEHRDTLNYLGAKIAGMIGDPSAVVTIHGGVHRDERRNIQERFRTDPEVRILVATDAAGEGVNLQAANLMVNYDLPWNPNRLEQRFGRIHRIGQTEVCHLWNLVAKETREGDVYFRLLEKLRIESTALKGRVFDILGEVFEGVSLRELLIEAIRYGDQPEIRAQIQTRVEGALDQKHVKEILDRNALANETMSSDRLFTVKEEMDKAEARRLQPHFVRAYFMEAFDSLGGTIHPRESGRFEITHVPAAIRERGNRNSAQRRRDTSPVMRRYERVCFTKDAMRPADKPGATLAQLLHPGHTLMKTVTDIVLEKHANLLRQGAIMVDPVDDGVEPSLLFILTHKILDGENQVLSNRLQFVRVSPQGQATPVRWAPHLDLAPLDPECRPLLYKLLDESWLRADLEQQALALAASSLVPEHFNEVASRRIAHVDKTLRAVHTRLTTEIAFWTERCMRLRDSREAGKDVRLPLENARRAVLDLEGRLENRKRELQAMRHVSSATPVALGGALVVPEGLLRQLKGESAPVRTTQLSTDAAARRRIELLAMDAVRRVEEAAGRRVVDVSAEKCGWDLTSYPSESDNSNMEPRHIEVKGRAQGAETITVTKNEILYALNQADKFVLAIVMVAEDDTIQGPFFVKHPFDAEPGWGVISQNIGIATLLERAEVVS